MTTNKKRVLHTDTMGKAGRDVLRKRDDVEAIPFSNFISPADYQALLKKHAPVAAVILGATSFGAAEHAAAGQLQVVARTGVGYDAIDIPAMTKAKVPVMIAGTANSPSVAEHAMYFMLTLARKGPELSALVKENRWKERIAAAVRLQRHVREVRADHRLRAHRHAAGQALPGHGMQGHGV